MDALDFLARFVIGGTAIILASDHLEPYSSLARRFFMSRAWPVLRYLTICAAIALCVVVLQHDWS